MIKGWPIGTQQISEANMRSYMERTYNGNDNVPYVRQQCNAWLKRLVKWRSDGFNVRA